jgi:hypothetical protein
MIGFFSFSLLAFHRYHCVIDESNRMCVHKTFPVSHNYRTIDRLKRQKKRNIVIDKHTADGHISWRSNISN